MNDETVKILTFVRHITGLKRNLISFGLLERSSYVYKTNKGVIRVSKDFLCFHE